MRASSLLIPLLAVSVACTDRDAPKPVPVSQEGARADAPSPSAQPADPDDPAEPGIGDLPRLARYVFKTMQAPEQVCQFANPFREPVHFALEIDVKGQRITRVGLAKVGVEEGGTDARTLARAQWPRELTSYVTCLAPHLEAVKMNPAPADGSYEPAYAFGGSQDGRPAP